MLPKTLPYRHPKCTKCAHHGCANCKRDHLEGEDPSKDYGVVWECCRCGLQNDILFSWGYIIVWVPPRNEWGLDGEEK
jgi:hypothetical protein